MRAFLALLLLAGCAAPKPSYPPPPFQVPSPPPASNPNFELIVSEVVPNPEDDGLSFTKLIVDGADKGQTPVGRKSEERRLSLVLPEGNMPVKLEHWTLTGSEWMRLDDSRQPRERFVRIEKDTIARLTLRFVENETSHSLSLAREGR